MAGPRIRDYKKIKSDDEVLNRVQDQVATSIGQLLRTDILDGRLIKEVSLTAGANTVEHKLDRVLRGWFITKKNAFADVHDAVTSQPDKFLVLQASAAVTVNLWVF